MVTTWHCQWMERLTTSTIPASPPSASTSAAKVRSWGGEFLEHNNAIYGFFFPSRDSSASELEKVWWPCCLVEYNYTTHIHTHTHRKLLLGRITERTFVEVRKVIS